VSRVCLDKLTVVQLVSSMPFLEPGNSIIVFTRNCHWFLSRTRCIQSTLSHSV